MWKSFNGDIARTLDSYYYLGAGNRGGVERDFLCWVECKVKKAIGIGNGQLHQIGMAEVTNPLDCMHDQQAVLIGGG